MCTSSSAKTAVNFMPVTTISGPLPEALIFQCPVLALSGHPDYIADVCFWHGGHELLHRTCLLLTHSGRAG